MGVMLFYDYGNASQKSMTDPRAHSEEGQEATAETADSESPKC